MSDNRFCEYCGDKTEYRVSSRQVSKTIRGVHFSYTEDYAVCGICSEEVFVPEIHDENIDRLEEAYRKASGLVSNEEIKAVMEKYDIAANPLSKVLGFGDVTIARYLAGQTPSKANSEKLLQVASSVAVMEKMLLESQGSITDVAFRKCKEAIDRYKEFNDNPNKIESVAQYLINQMSEVTPMALQKLLYYCQSFFAALNTGIFLFEDDCQAWVHGPVYPDVYYKYQQFGYMPIDSLCDRFERPEDKLTLKELEILDQVIKTFGRFSGPVLERITHLEEPWIHARGSLQPADRCTCPISKESIIRYFSKVVHEYKIASVDDIDCYCIAMYRRV